jgi:hypothetical protein
VVVQDVAAVCAQVERLGGKVLVPPTTSKDYRLRGKRG